jgi:hypothetical protein
MKKYFLLLFFSSTALATLAQPAIDSIRSNLQTETKDSSRSLLLIELSRRVNMSNPDSGLMLGQQAFYLAKKANFAVGEARAMNAMANAFRAIGNNVKALSFYLEALKKAEAIESISLQGSLNGNISNVYAAEGNHRKSVDYVLKSLSFARQLGDQRKVSIALANLGDCYEKLDILDSAKYFTNAAYDMALKANDVDILAVTLGNLGNTYSKLQQPDVAMANYRLSLPYLQQAQYDEGLAEINLGMARLFLNSGQQDSALFYARSSFRIGEEAGFMPRVAEAGSFLADYYKKQNQVDSAYRYLNVLLSTKDSLYSQEKNKQLQNLFFDEQNRQQELAAASELAAAERKTNIQYAFIALGLVTFIILFFLLSKSVIVHEKWIRFFGILGLLLVFEFINLYFHTYIADLTHHSPLLMLIALVCIAALLIPLHHRIEHWVLHKVVAKNQKIKVVAAKKTLERLEGGSPY